MNGISIDHHHPEQARGARRHTRHEAGRSKAHRAEKTGHEHTHRSEKSGRRRGARLFHHAANHKLHQRFAASLSVSASASFYSNNPAEIADAAGNLIRTVSGLLERSADTSETLPAIRESLAEARSEAKELAANEVENEGIDDTAALVNRSLEKISDSDETVPSQIGDPVEIKARRRNGFSLKIRTQEGDIVKLSLRTSESLSVTDQSANAGDREISLSANARLKLRVFGELSEAEFSAMRGVFEEAAEVARDFYNGDLAAAIESVQSFEFDQTQIAKIRLRFRSATSVNALYSPHTSAVLPPEPEEAAPAQAASNEAATQVETDPATAQAQPAQTQAQAQADDSPDAANSSAVNNFVEEISAYFSAVRNSGSTEGALWRINAFRLDILKATLIVSADENQDEAARSVAAAIEDAALSHAEPATETNPAVAGSQQLA